MPQLVSESVGDVALVEIARRVMALVPKFYPGGSRAQGSRQATELANSTYIDDGGRHGGRGAARRELGETLPIGRASSPVICRGVDLRITDRDARETDDVSRVIAVEHDARALGDQSTRGCQAFEKETEKEKE